MPRKFIDLSVALETGIVSDPPMALPEIEYVDHHGNACVLLTFEKDTKSVSVLAQGDVEINQTNAVTNEESLIPKWLFKRQTELAKPGVAIKKFCRDFTGFT